MGLNQVSLSFENLDAASLLGFYRPYIALRCAHMHVD